VVVPLLALLPLLILAAIALIPFSLVQRYRMSTRRQRARAWLISLNLAGLSVSAFLFVIGAGFTGIWVPHALSYSIAGLAAGALMGILGLLVTKWEVTADGLYYTPSRVLVLAITVLVSARIAYGFWRALHVWRTAAADDRWLGAAGIADSMAAGAIVLGYYLAYWIGVRRRMRRVPRTAGSTPRPPRAVGAGRSRGAQERAPADLHKSRTRSA
jgi:hypothetical protein